MDKEKNSKKTPEKVDVKALKKDKEAVIKSGEIVRK